MTTEQRILQIEAELASLKADLAMEPPTMERQGTTYDDLLKAAGAKDWEILEFQRVSDRQSYYRKENGRYVNSERSEKGVIGLHEMLHEDACVDSGHYIIHSVRRLSDNSVWTVGDVVLMGSYSAPQKIQRFFIDSGGMRVETDQMISGIHKLIKVLPNQPLHATADGIRVTKDQKLYNYLSSGDIETHPTWEDASDKYSSEAAAKAAYHLWLYKQPVLSLDDILGLQGCPEPVKSAKAIVQQKLATR